MVVTTKINVDFRQPNAGAHVNAVQNDVNTRAVEIHLFNGGAVWKVPEGVTAAVAYKKQDYKKGTYDMLPDGSKAVTISGSVVTVIMAQQMLTTAGIVSACLVLTDDALNQLTTFPFSVRVEANPSADAQQSEDYIRLKWLEDKLDEYLEKNPSYTLPIATENTLGGVKAAAATEEMTQPVGITAEGKLVTVPVQNFAPLRIVDNDTGKTYIAEIKVTNGKPICVYDEFTGE